LRSDRQADPRFAITPEAPAMNRQVEKLGSVTVLTVLEVHLDAGNANEFKTIIAGLQDTSPYLVLDLSQVRFLDSSGCGAILTAVRCLDRVGGHIRICGLTESALETFTLFQMLRILDVYQTREEAIHAFGRG